MGDVKIVRDAQGNTIVLIPDIIFWNKQDIDWDAVKELKNIMSIRGD